MLDLEKFVCNEIPNAWATYKGFWKAKVANLGETIFEEFRFFLFPLMTGKMFWINCKQFTLVCNSQHWSRIFKHAVSTGPLAHGHLIWPSGHLVWHSTGLDWPLTFKNLLPPMSHVRSTTGKYCFHRCLSVHRGGGGRYPNQGEYPHPGGVPPVQRWGTPPSSMVGYLPGPRIGQQMDYLTCGGQYASCVHEYMQEDFFVLAIKKPIEYFKILILGAIYDFLLWVTVTWIWPGLPKYIPTVNSKWYSLVTCELLIFCFLESDLSNYQQVTTLCRRSKAPIWLHVLYILWEISGRESKFVSPTIT